MIFLKYSRASIHFFFSSAAVPRSNRNLSASADPTAGSFGSFLQAATAPTSTTAAARTAARQRKARNEKPGNISATRPFQRLDHPLVFGGQARIECMGWTKVEVLAGTGRICKRIAHVAFLGVLAADIQAAAGNPGQAVEYRVEGHPASPADVIDGAGASAVACRSRRLGRVGNEREVAGLLAITVNRDGLAGKGGAKELVEGHVRPLPRPVHGEIPQRHGRNVVVHKVEVAQMFSGELGDP